MTYQKAFNRCIYQSQKTLSRTYHMGNLKIHLDKNLFFFPERNRPNRGEFKWTSGADRDRDPSRSCRPYCCHLFHCQAETFAEQVRSWERAERRGKQTAEGEQSRSLSWAAAEVGIVEILTDANAWIHSVQRQGLDVTSQLSRRCCRVSQGLDTCDHGKCNEWTSNQGFQGFKSGPKCIQIDIMRERWEEFKLKNWKTLLRLILCPNLEKPGQLQELPQPGGFHPKNRLDLDCHHFETWTWCEVSHKENRSLIFMRDLLLLTLDHQNVATKMAPASSYTAGLAGRWLSQLWQISNL